MYTIRNCVRDDLQRLIELCSKHAAYEHAVYFPEGKAERLASALFCDVPPLHCWVVETEGRVVGYCSFTFDYSTWDAAPFLHMDCLYLEDTFRGLGIGSAIIKKLRELAVEKKCINVQWQTPVENRSGILFYEKIGAVAKSKMRFHLGN
jgi:GNAT superfamily N-acetyltransferase